MKNIVRQLLCITLFISSTTVFSQTDKLEMETAFMNCIYNSLSDNGKEFKLALQNAEQKLIDKSFLKGKTGEDYVALYKNLENVIDQELRNLGMTNLFMSLQENMNTEESRKCMENIFTSSKYANSKLNQFIQFTQNLDETTIDASTLVNKILTILGAKSFEHDYYRMTTFLMIETMNQVKIDGIVRELPKEVEETFTKEELESALKIEFNAEGQLFVSDKKTPLKKLRKKVITYLKENKSKSVILIKHNREVSYKFFIDVQNELLAGFDVVRNELAKEKFNRLFDELQEAEKAEIKKTYPLKIKSSDIDE
jgi:biopolymer transport protein ExbD